MARYFKIEDECAQAQRLKVIASQGGHYRFEPQASSAVADVEEAGYGSACNPPCALPTAAVPEILIVSMPPLPPAACDIKDDAGSNHKGDDKNGNRMIHRNLPCCQNERGTAL